ncbi:MAG TPA: lipocalin family protein [Mucilaginibacter sp.]|jgi:hypothetical protein|nr:lipocalin family protein [Mucilaginibacter sp.]
MKLLPFIALGAMALAACKQNTATTSATTTESPLNGTWRLVSSKSIVKKDTTDTSPKKGTEDLKIYNDTHFTFFSHNTDKSVPASYDSGAGTYTLKGDNYTEHLQYCSEREWENHDFNFTMAIKGDTMQQRGVEKVDSGSVHIDHIIIETYAKMK